MAMPGCLRLITRSLFLGGGAGSLASGEIWGGGAQDLRVMARHCGIVLMWLEVVWV